MQVSVLKWLFQDHMASHLTYPEIAKVSLTCHSLHQIGRQLLRTGRRRYKRLTKMGFLALSCYRCDDDRMIDVAVHTWGLKIRGPCIWNTHLYEKYRPYVHEADLRDLDLSFG